MLALDAILVLATRVEASFRLHESGRVSPQCFFRDQVQPNAADARGCTDEVTIDQRGAEADRFP